MSGEWVPGKTPKVHAPDLTEEATRLANLVGMQASGQPWQAGAAGSDTTALLEVVHPDLAALEANPPVVVDADGFARPITAASTQKPLSAPKSDAKAKKDAPAPLKNEKPQARTQKPKAKKGDK